MIPLSCGSNLAGRYLSNCVISCDYAKYHVLLANFSKTKQMPLWGNIRYLNGKTMKNYTVIRRWLIHGSDDFTLR
jgi:hypothetical protein